MKSVGLSFFSDINLTSIGLVIFLSVFLIHVFMQYFVKSDAQVDLESKLPFDGEIK